MIRKYNNISLALGIPGLVLQVAGKLMENNAVLVVGLLLLLAGFAYYAKAKGRSPAWGLLAFLSIIGLIILACLKDHHAARRRGDTPRSSASPLAVVAVIVVLIPVLLMAAGMLLPALNAFRHQAGRQSSGPNDRHDADGHVAFRAPDWSPPAVPDNRPPFRSEGPTALLVKRERQFPTRIPLAGLVHSGRHRTRRSPPGPALLSKQNPLSLALGRIQPARFGSRPCFVLTAVER